MLLSISTSQSTLKGEQYHSPHCTERETEAQRGDWICTGSPNRHSWEENSGPETQSSPLSRQIILLGRENSFNKCQQIVTCPITIGLEAFPFYECSSCPALLAQLFAGKKNPNQPSKIKPKQNKTNQHNEKHWLLNY